MILIVHVDYEETKPETYDGIRVISSTHTKISVRFNSGEFVEDYNDMMMYVDRARENGAVVLGTSSVDNFFLECRGKYQVRMKKDGVPA